MIVHKFIIAMIEATVPTKNQIGLLYISGSKIEKKTTPLGAKLNNVPKTIRMCKKMKFPSLLFLSRKILLGPTAITKFVIGSQKNIAVSCIARILRS